MILGWDSPSRIMQIIGYSLGGIVAGWMLGTLVFYVIRQSRR
jgi:hypothetical protein